MHCNKLNELVEALRDQPASDITTPRTNGGSAACQVF